MSAREHRIHNHLYGHILFEEWTKKEVFIPPSSSFLPRLEV